MGYLVVDDIVTQTEITSAGLNAIFAQVENFLNNTTASANVKITGTMEATGGYTDPVLNGTISGTAFLDEDNMASDSATKVASQQSIKAYIPTVKLDDFAAPDDNTDLDATTLRHGLLPKLGGGTTNFLRADGTWNAVATTSTKLDDFTTPDDNTDLNATTSAHGLCPKLGGGTTTFLRADGTWNTPAGTGFTGAGTCIDKEVFISNGTAGNTAMRSGLIVSQPSGVDAEVQLKHNALESTGGLTAILNDLYMYGRLSGISYIRSIKAGLTGSYKAYPLIIETESQSENFAGAPLTIRAGNGSGALANGGALALSSGTSGSSGDGGAITITAGDGRNHGGDIAITSGAATSGMEEGGDLSITAGAGNVGAGAAGGNGGHLYLTPGAAGNAEAYVIPGKIICNKPLYVPIITGTATRDRHINWCGIYAKSDNRLYYIGSDGWEYRLANG